MGQLQKVSWRTVGYSALGTAVAAASVIAVFNSDGVRPTALTSSSATKWLVDNAKRQVVLVDGLAGHVVAKVQLDSATDSGKQQEAVQGAGGAFLIDRSQASVRTISTSKLQLGTPQTVGILNEQHAMFGVGSSGLTILSPDTHEARVVAVDDVTRPVEKITPSSSARVAFDGSIWLFTDNTATHVSVDKPNDVQRLRYPPHATTTIGARAVMLDADHKAIEWSGGGTVPVDSIVNVSEAGLQEPGDDATCAWLAVGDRMACVGPDRIEQSFPVPGLNFNAGAGDRLAVSGTAAVIVRGSSNQIQRIDMETRAMATGDKTPSPGVGAHLVITATGSLVWIDDTIGSGAWVVHRLGINPIDKDDKAAPLLDAQGQQTDPGVTGSGDGQGAGTAPSEDQSQDDKLDNNGVEDPPVAVPDSVTARAGTTITIPVTVNDYDPDGDPIAVVSVGDGANKPAGHGLTDVLTGNTVDYRPDAGFSGTDSFEYTITDPSGETNKAMVTVELFPPGSPNQPPIARGDTASTKPGRPVTIDVLANDIDPERDQLTVSTFAQKPGDTAKITDTKGPSGLPALLYTPPAEAGIYEFTYQAADPQGGLSAKTTVTVQVSGANAPNAPPKANPDSIRLAVGVVGNLDVKANDIDPDGEDLTLTAVHEPPGVSAKIVAQRLEITLGPGAAPLSVIKYTITAASGLTDDNGQVLVVRLDSVKNRPPVANADSERVVVGNTVKIPVTANDVDPDHDPITLLSVTAPANGAGTTTVEGNSVRFTPTLQDLKEPTPVTFSYTISDGHENTATGNVTVTILLEALPRAPFARDDFADTVVDKPVTIDVLANDSDPSGGRPNLTGSPACPSGGEAKITSDERVVFTPPAGATGTYRCKYTVTNNQGLQGSASIIVTVSAATPGNHPPTVDQSALLIPVTLGQPQVVNANTIGRDIDGDALVFTSVDSPSTGSTSIGTNPANLTYTPPQPDSSGNVPAVVTVRFTISDGHDGNVSDALSFKLTNPTTATQPGVPPAPVIPTDIIKATTAGLSLPVDVAKELKEANPGDPLTLKDAKWVSGPGTVQWAGNVVTFVTTAAGELVASYTVTNAAGGSASGKIRVTVSEVIPNNPPVANDDQLNVQSGGSNSVNLMANDTGITDPGDKPLVTLGARPPSSFGTVQLNSATGALFFSAAANPLGGNVTIPYTLSDGSGQTSTANVLISVARCDQSAPAVRDANLFTPYQTPINIDLTQFVLAGTIRPGSPSGAGLNGATTGVYTPPAGKNDPETITYVVENGCGQTVDGLVTIDVNRPPVAGTISRQLPRGGAPLVLGVADLATDDEPLSITGLTGNPSWVTSTDNTVRADPPPGTPADTYTMKATVQDPGGLTAVATINLIITNIAPTAVADSYNATKSTFSFDPTLNDVDPEGGPLCIQTVAVTSGAGSAVVFPDPNAPPAGCNTQVTVSLGHGVTTLAYTIRDDGGLTSNSTISILFNHAPSVGDAVAVTNGQGSTQVEVHVTEPDGDPVSLACNTGPGANPDFGVSVSGPLNSGPDPSTQPRFNVTVTVLQPFNQQETIPCVATDSFGATSNVGTITVVVVDGG